MKMRKVLLTVFSALLIVTLSVGATVAFLTSTDEVKNTFTVGKVGIHLFETIVNEYGVASSTSILTSEGNAYKLMPGHTYTKDPHIVPSIGSEQAWLFVKVDNGVAAIEAASTTEHPNIATQMANNGWYQLPGTDVYAHNTIASAADDRWIFGEFTIANDADVSKYTDAKIVITAYAVQAAGFDTPAAAWAATFGAAE